MVGCVFSELLNLDERLFSGCDAVARDVASYYRAGSAEPAQAVNIDRPILSDGLINEIQDVDLPVIDEIPDEPISEPDGTVELGTGDDVDDSGSPDDDKPDEDDDDDEGLITVRPNLKPETLPNPEVDGTTIRDPEGGHPKPPEGWRPGGPEGGG